MTGVSDGQIDNRTYTKSPQHSMSIFQPGTTMTTMMQNNHLAENSYNAAPVTEVREPGDDDKGHEEHMQRAEFATFEQESLESPNAAANLHLQENSLFLDRSTSHNEHAINNTLTENSFLNAGVSRINNSFQNSVLGC